MRLPFMQPRSDASGTKRPAAVADDAGSLQALRTQARRRFMGALVLLVVAVAGFPLLFETQPRPLPGQAGEEAAAVSIRAEGTGRSSRADTAGAPAAERPVAVAAPAAEKPVAVAVAAPAVEKPEAAPSAPAMPRTEAPSPASKPVPEAVKKSPDSRAPDTVALPSPAAAPAPAASAPGADLAARWVVQVGAYNDMERMRQARQKAEKLGFKTYTTEVDSPTGKRTRVRLGPFATKKEAETAAVKVKANGMAANVLSL